MRAVYESSEHDYNQYYRGTVVFYEQQGLKQPLYVHDIEENDEYQFKGETSTGAVIRVNCEECFVIIPDVFARTNGGVFGTPSSRGHKKGLQADPSDLMMLFRAVNFSAPRSFGMHRGFIQYRGFNVGYVADGVNYIANEILIDRFRKETLQEAVCLEL